MLLLKLFLILLAAGGAWRMIACAYAGRAAWWFAVLYSLFFVGVIAAVWYFLPQLDSLKLLIPLLILLALLYLPILFCFTKGWREKEAGREGSLSGRSYSAERPNEWEIRHERSQEKDKREQGQESASDGGGDGGGGD